MSKEDKTPSTTEVVALLAGVFVIDVASKSIPLLVNKLKKKRLERSLNKTIAYMVNHRNAVEKTRITIEH